MTSNWKECKLGDLCKIKGGKRLPAGKNLTTKPNTHPYIRVRDLTNIKTLNLTPDFEYVDDEVQKTIDRYIVNTGDVIISIVGTIGLISIIGPTLDNANLTENCAKLIDLKGIDNHFLYYYLISNEGQQEINRNSVGAVQAKLPLYGIGDIRIILPPLEIQRKIAKVLSAIDDKIELNNSINNNLEQQMDLLYCNIFIDDTDFIELGSVIETTSGGTPSRKNLNFYKNGTVNWVKSKELLGTYLIDTEECITEDAVKKSSAKILPEQSVLVAMYGATVGAYGIISKKMTCNQAICALIQNEKYPYSYIYQNVKFAKSRLENMAVGSAQQNISQVLIKQLPVHSNLIKIKKYCNIADTLMSKILNIQNENTRLSQLRDTLLPKLMSGEIDVDKVEV